MLEFKPDEDFRAIILVRDCINENEIYGYLVMKRDKKTNTFRFDDIQKRIYELKNEIGDEYTVNEIMDIIVDEFDDVIEFQYYMQDFEI